MTEEQATALTDTAFYAEATKIVEEAQRLLDELRDKAGEELGVYLDPGIAALYDALQALKGEDP